MQRCESLKDLKRAFREITSGCAGDTIWMAKASLYLIEMLDDRLPKVKRAAKPTAYQQFFARGMRDGLAPKEIGRRWRAQRQRVLKHIA